MLGRVPFAVIVTEDMHLLRLKQHGSARIVRATDFLAMIDEW